MMVVVFVVVVVGEVEVVGNSNVKKKKTRRGKALPVFLNLVWYVLYDRKSVHSRGKNKSKKKI